MPTSKPTFEIIVPFYNEAGRIPAAVTDLGRECAKSELLRTGVPIRFWWADDGSTDGSYVTLLKAIAENFPKQVEHRVLRRPHNQGKGSILRYAIDNIRGEVAPGSLVALWDADGELDSHALFSALNFANEHQIDLLFGARIPEPDLGFSDKLRLFANRALTWFSNSFSGLELSDVHCCAKVVRAEVLFALPFTSHGFDFEAEFAGLVAKVQAQLRVGEIGIGYHPRRRREGKKIGAVDIFPQIVQALRCHFRQKPIELIREMPRAKKDPPTLSP